MTLLFFILLPYNISMTRILALLALATAAASIPTGDTNHPLALEARSSASIDGPVVDLSKAGKYLGIMQNNGTVHSWKGTSPSLLCSRRDGR
jgi:hypothetical protein